MITRYIIVVVFLCTPAFFSPSTTHILSPLTPPGTKLKLTGKVEVQNGFLLLKKSSITFLGGQVEALLKKWNLQKVAVSIVSVYYVSASCTGMILCFDWPPRLCQSWTGGGKV